MPRSTFLVLIGLVLSLVACGVQDDQPSTVDAVGAVAEEPPAAPAVQDRPLFAASALARDALDQGDWPTAQQHLEAALAHAPGLPQTRFRLAEVILRQGDPGPALEHLEVLVEIGARVDLTESEIFAPFLDLPEVAALARALDPARPRPSDATVLATLAQDQWTEGIAIDSTTGQVYAGSLERHHIVRVDPDGVVEDFVRDDASKFPSMVGMAIDSERRLLWVVAGIGSDRPVAPVPRDNVLVQYDLDDGRKIGEYRPETDHEAQRLLNDVAVAPDGTVYVTESFESAIWRWRPDDALRRWRIFPEHAYLNGLAVSDDGSLLWAVAVEGLVWVDPATGESGRVVAPDAAFAGLGDGIAVLDQGLVIVQNDDFLGQRIARFDLDATGRRIVGAKVLPFAWPSGLLPYTVAVDERRIVVVATADLSLRESPDSGTVPAPTLMQLAR